MNFLKWKDILKTNAVYVLPSFLRWLYHLKVKKDVLAHPLADAILYEYKGGGSGQAVLILHGLHTHPYIMHPIAVHALTKGPVFSLYVSYNKSAPTLHRESIKRAIDFIENHTPSFNGISLIGHSMGAIEGAHTAYKEKDARIRSLISIAGRLKAIPGIEAIGSAPPFYHIVGRKDWNAPLESMILPKVEGFYHIIDDAHHVDILFHKELYRILPIFLRT